MERYKMNQLNMEKLAQGIFFTIALISVIVIFLICFFLFVNALPVFSQIGLVEFVTGKEWAPTDNPAYFGILPMILGSLYITAGAIVIGVPVGVFTAIFLACFCPYALYKLIKPCVNLLAGIPSIIYGFFGLMVIVPVIKIFFGGNGNTILTASLLLGIMILPTVISVSESAIKAVPKNYYEGALALGASHERSVFFVVLPAVASGVMASIVLGIGRAVGETMAVIMVAGNQARMPEGFLKGIRSLTANIVLEMGYAADLHKDALIATGVVLFILILLVNISFMLVMRRARI